MNTWKVLLIDTDVPDVLRRAVSKLLIRDRINPEKFVHNYGYLARGGMKSFHEFYGIDDGSGCPTPTAKELADPLKRLGAYPNWFLAAYPDVAVWLQEVFVRGYRNESDPMVARVYGAMEEVLGKGFSAEEMRDDDGLMNFDYLKALVSTHRGVSGSQLECSVQSG